MERKTTPPRVRRIVETVLGCKWSLTALTLIDEGTNRPGQMVRSADGLTAKVLNHCLSRLMSFGIVEKKAYPEIPPRVEYHITRFGRRFMRIYEVIDDLERELTSEEEDQHNDEPPIKMTGH